MVTTLSAPSSDFTTIVLSSTSSRRRPCHESSGVGSAVFQNRRDGLEVRCLGLTKDLEKDHFHVHHHPSKEVLQTFTKNDKIRVSYTPAANPIQNIDENDTIFDFLPVYTPPALIATVVLLLTSICPTLFTYTEPELN